MRKREVRHLAAAAGRRIVGPACDRRIRRAGDALPCRRRLRESTTTPCANERARGGAPTSPFPADNPGAPRSRSRRDRRSNERQHRSLTEREPAQSNPGLIQLWLGLHRAARLPTCSTAPSAPDEDSNGTGSRALSGESVRRLDARPSRVDAQKRFLSDLLRDVGGPDDGVTKSNRAVPPTHVKGVETCGRIARRSRGRVRHRNSPRSLGPFLHDSLSLQHEHSDAHPTPKGSAPSGENWQRSYGGTATLRPCAGRRAF